jgi:hypothetical protein
MEYFAAIIAILILLSILGIVNVILFLLRLLPMPILEILSIISMFVPLAFVTLCVLSFWNPGLLIYAIPCPLYMLFFGSLLGKVHGEKFFDKKDEESE